MESKEDFLRQVDDESERAVLAALMQPLHRGYVIDIVQPNMFANPLRALIASAIFRLLERGDAVTVTSVYTEARTAAAIQGLSAPQLTPKMILAIQEYDISTRVVEADARRVESLWRLRQVEPQLRKVVHAMSSNDPKRVSAAISEMYDAMRVSMRAGDNVLYGSDVARFSDRIVQEARQNANLYPFPWDGWAKQLKPLLPGLMALLALPPGYGKTAMATTIALHWVKLGHRVVFFHTEYPHEFMVARLICSLAGITDIDRFIAGQLDDEEEKRRKKAQDYWEKNCKYFHLVNAGGFTVDELITVAGHMHAAGDCTAIIIDYWTDLDHGKEERMDAMFRGMSKFHHALAQWKIPAVVVAQGTKEMANAHIDELSPTMINMPNNAIAKAQVVIIGTRSKIPYDGAETMYVNGVPQPFGLKGQLSPIIDLYVAKQTIGYPVRGSLLLTKNMIVTSLPPEDPRSRGA